jgi:PKD repeat protein
MVVRALVVALSANLAAATTIKAQSATTGEQTPYFSATPISGRVPLTVTFCASVGIALDFGDGASSAMGMTQRGECPAGLTSYLSHTYAAVGTYQLRGLPCPGSMYTTCGAVAQQASAVQITVLP